MRVTLVISAFVLINGVSTNSTPVEKYLFECHEKLQNHIEMMINFDLNNHLLRKELMESCDPVLKCLGIDQKTDNYHGKKPTLQLTLIVAVNSLCKLTILAETIPCFKKIQDSDSECSKSWMLKLPKEILRNELAREKACKNYFGKDACMEQEVTELCGEKLWLEFRDLIVKLSDPVWRKYFEWEQVQFDLFDLVKAAVERNLQFEKFQKDYEES